MFGSIYILIYIMIFTHWFISKYIFYNSRLMNFFIHLFWVWTDNKSSFLWPHGMLFKLSVLWNLLRCALWPNRWLFFINYSHVHNKNMFFGVSYKHIHLIKFNCTIQTFHMFIDFLEMCSITKIHEWKFPTALMDLSFTPCTFVNFCYRHVVAF